MDIQSRNPVLDNVWRGGASRPAGLYGELPALPALDPVKAAPASRPLRKTAATE